MTPEENVKRVYPMSYAQRKWSITLQDWLFVIRSDRSNSKKLSSGHKDANKSWDEAQKSL